jgi:hypothetical protein
MNQKKCQFMEIDFLLITKLNLLANYYDVTVHDSSAQFPLNFNFKNFENLKINAYTIQSYFSQLFGKVKHNIFLNLQYNENIDDLLVFLLRFYEFRLYMIFKPKNDVFYVFNEEELVIINWIHVYSEKIKNLSQLDSNVLTTAKNKKNLFGQFFYHFYAAQFSSDKFTLQQSFYSNQLRNIYQNLFKRKQFWFDDPASILVNKDDFVNYFDFYENFIDQDFILLSLFKSPGQSNSIKLADYVFYDHNNQFYFTIFTTTKVLNVRIDNVQLDFGKRNQFLILNLSSFDLKGFQKNDTTRFEILIDISVNDVNLKKKFILIHIGLSNRNNIENTIKTLQIVTPKIDQHKQLVKSIMKYTLEIEFREHANLNIIKNGVFEGFEKLRQQFDGKHKVISKFNHVFYAPDNNSLHEDVSFCLNILKKIPDILYNKMQQDKNLEMLNLFYKKYDQNFASYVYKTLLISNNDFQNFDLLRLLGLTLNSQGMFETSVNVRNFDLTKEFDLNILPKYFSPKRFTNFQLDTFFIEKYTNLIILDFDFFFEILQITVDMIIINFEILFKSIFWSEFINQDDINKNKESLELRLDFRKKNSTMIKSYVSNAINFDSNHQSWLSLENHDKLILNSNKIKYDNIYFKLYKLDSENFNFKKNDSKTEKYILIFSLTEQLSNIKDCSLNLQITDSFGNVLNFIFKKK